MSCLLGCLAFAAPRALLAILWAQGYVERAFETVLWPALGFALMPLTTAAYAWAIAARGSVEGAHFVIVVLAVLADLGVIGGATKGD